MLFTSTRAADFVYISCLGFYLKPLQNEVFLQSKYFPFACVYKYSISVIIVFQFAGHHLSEWKLSLHAGWELSHQPRWKSNNRLRFKKVSNCPFYSKQILDYRFSFSLPATNRELCPWNRATTTRTWHFLRMEVYCSLSMNRARPSSSV